MAVNRRRENRLNGLFPLSYVGVIPTSPSNFIQDSRPPTQYDSKNFYIGDYWLDISSDVSPGYVAPTINNLWILVSQDKGLATWISFGSGGMVLETLTGNNTGVHVPPTANNINTIGDGVGITVTGNAGTSTLTWSLVGGGTAAQSFSTDSGTATPNGSGVLNIVTNQAANAAGITTFFSGSGNVVQFHNTDPNGNVMFGDDSGKSGMSGTHNSALGQVTLAAITSGSSNTALGFGALNLLTTSSNNTAIGAGALLNVVTGAS